MLLVSQLYPGPEDPDLGVFVRDLETALAARGHEIERAVLDRRAGGKLRYLELARATLERARRFRPDVVYAHFLVPTGLIAALASRAPLVATAHGRDVRVSDYLRRELETKVPEARGKTEVVPSGVDLQRFRVAQAPNGAPRFLCVGSLTPRKNVVRLACAFERLGDGTLTFVGDGPLRRELEGRPGITLAGAVRHDDVPRYMADASVVCQPSLIEPFGQGVLEALACGRTVVTTRIGGPPEFVPAEAGLLVDPADEDALADALRAAASFPCPNDAARAAAEPLDVRRQAERVEEILTRAVRGRRA